MNALNTALQSTQTTVQETLLSLPQQLKAQLPLSAPLKLQIAEQRQTIQNILDGKDHRLMVITGPCSIHDPIAVLEYAEKLKQLQTKVSDQIFFVMRAYIEKPRTTVGWKGFLYDPLLDGSSNMQLGLEQSRALYLAIIEMGLPIATEILSPMATAYFDDLLAWGPLVRVPASRRFIVKFRVICHSALVSKMAQMVQFKLLWMRFSLHQTLTSSWELGSKAWHVCFSPKEIRSRT